MNLCVCSKFVFEDVNTETCPKCQFCPSEGYGDNTGKVRMKQFVLCNIVTRLRTMFANPLLAKYLAYAAERNPDDTVYYGDVWDRHPRLKRMDADERRVNMCFSFTADGAETRKNKSTKPCVMYLMNAHPILRYFSSFILFLCLCMCLCFGLPFFQSTL